MSGFNLQAGEPVPSEAKADQEDLAQYILRSAEYRRAREKQIPVSSLAQAVNQYQFRDLEIEDLVVLLRRERKPPPRVLRSHQLAAVLDSE
jgi:hypothetical protein